MYAKYSIILLVYDSVCMYIMTCNVHMYSIRPHMHMHVHICIHAYVRMRL